ncbi:FtsX-like permease family protein [Collinsella sp. AGMB00827]|uniref:FtsX-like permease family protein n=1 Tax=Collinsella ureilytica TaxID=2869515 RepID=A0ABS7MLP0_9ACTN|nr:FtsX-like permease family protein [Collinsella urealyticum]MBY4798223.1 FtsX-like permease family protein [Collinsella urealyticum]
MGGQRDPKVRRAPQTARSRRLSALSADIRRTITGNLKRFVSLFVICALGSTMLVGLKAACDDLRLTADSYFDTQRLFDLSIRSTLGLTDADIAALAGLSDVDYAQGGYTEAAFTEVHGKAEKVDLKALVSGDLNKPLLIDGCFPRDARELVVTQKYAHAAKKKIGDTVRFSSGAILDEGDEPKADPASEHETDATQGATTDANDIKDTELPKRGDPVFSRGVYTIVGVVRDPMDVNPESETMTFRTGSITKYAFFLSPEAVVHPNTYTVAYLAIAKARELPCYSDAYRTRIEEAKTSIETIRDARERGRTADVKDEASARVDDEERRAERELADAATKLHDAERTLDAQSDELSRGKRELSLQEALAAKEIRAGHDKIQSGYAELAAGEEELAARAGELSAGAARLAAGRSELGRRRDAAYAEAEAAVTAQLAAPKAELAAQTKTLDEAYARAKSERDRLRDAAQKLGLVWPDQAWSTFEELTAPGAEVVPEQVASAKEALAGKAASAVADARPKLTAQKAELQAGEAALRPQLEAAKTALAALDPANPQHAERMAMLKKTIAELEAQLAAVQEGLAGIEFVLSGGWEAALVSLSQGFIDIQAGYARLAQAASELGQREAEARQQARAEVDRAIGQAAAELANKSRELEQGQAALKQGRALLDQNRIRLAAGLSDLNARSAEADQRFAEAHAELDAGAQKLADAREELRANYQTFEDERSEAHQKIADARADIETIEPATWYVQDRSVLPSYNSVDSDAKSIEAIATVFPAIFFIVAVLIGLTTATRMVEEDRGLIGVYKALGYHRSQIMAKYLIYACTACISGGLAGTILGFVALPVVIFTIFRTMYALTDFELHVDPMSALVSVALFTVGITGAAALACRQELREVPASLMRPRAPRAGGRIMLERIPPLWRRLGFLNKVAARNLFRYKKRAFMTIFGIAGCTALLICGLGIRDTVISLKPRQYGDAGIARYDLMAVTADADFEEARQALSNSGEVSELLCARIETVTAGFQGKREDMQIVVLPDGTDLSGFVKLQDGQGSELQLPAHEGGIFTKNAEQVLGFSAGDAVSLQDVSLAEGSIPVSAIAINYLGNFVYMTESAYRTAFGTAPVQNAFFAHLTGSEDDQIAFAKDLGDDGLFVSLSSTAQIANSFSESFKIVDVVVYIVTVMGAALAFAVVFTLSTTNISERARELATIKVLGFRRREVYRYINKETIVLALLGILAGCPLGYAITRFLTYVLRMPSLFFDTVVAWPTYFIASAVTLAFVVVVSKMTNRSLDRIAMVEALKSAE